MPTYEYKCSACGHGFEEFQPISSKPIRKCPKCGKLAVNRLISTGGGIIFRGSAFYQTDYRSESYKAGAKKESNEGKPAAATDTKSAGTDKNDPASAAPAPAATASSTSNPPQKSEGKKSKLAPGNKAAP